MKQTWAVENTIYINADTYEKAVSKFWKKMKKAGVGCVVAGDKRRDVLYRTSRALKRALKRPSKKSS